MKKMNIKNNKTMKKVGKWTSTGAKFGASCAGGFVPMTIAAAGANVVIPGAGLIPAATKFGIEFVGFSIGFDATEDMINKAAKKIKHHKKHSNNKHQHKETKKEENK